MVHVNFVVEGQTEEAFVNGVLVPVLGEKKIFSVARAVEISRTKGRIYRGGVNSCVKIKHDVEQWLKQHKDAYVTTMFDFYALPGDFPGRHLIADRMISPYEQVAILEQAFADDIDSRRFIPYIQLHEYEALLFVEIEKLGRFYLEHGRAIQRLKRYAETMGSPELINQTATGAPSKRILREIPNYDKVLYGAQMAEEIGLENLRSKCKHFDEWLAKIEALV